MVDTLLVNERVIDLMLPRLIPRTTLVERGQLAPRQYYIDVSDEEEKDAGEEEDNDYESDSD